MLPSSRVRSDSVDRILGLVLLVVAFIWLGLAFTYIPGARGDAETGPRAFPVLLGIVLAGLGIVMSLSPASGGGTIAPLTRHESKGVAGTIGALVLYAFLLERLGFLIATPIVIAVTMRVLVGVRKAPLIAGLAVGFTVCCWAIFGLGLGTPLPRGSWVLSLR